MRVYDTGADYEPLPLGMQSAVLVNVFDLGLQRGYGGAPQHECVFLWELEARKKDGTPFLATKRYTASLNEKANLRRDMRSWKGMDFTAAEIEAGVELTSFLGVNSVLNLVKKTKANNKEFTDIETVMHPGAANIRRLKAQTPRDYVPEWVSKAIAEQLPPDTASGYSGATDDGRGGFV